MINWATRDGNGKHRFRCRSRALKSGRWTCSLPAWTLHQCKKQVAFTDVYYKGGYTIVVRKDNTDITGYDTITGKTVGAQVASKAGDHAKEHGATIKEFDTNSQGWMELEAGTVDAISIDKAVAQDYMTHGGNEKAKIVGDPILSRGTAMAISKDKPELLKQFNDALSQIKKDGTYAKIYKKWFGEEPKDQDL